MPGQRQPVIFYSTDVTHPFSRLIKHLRTSRAAQHLGIRREASRTRDPQQRELPGKIRRPLLGFFFGAISGQYMRPETGDFVGNKHA
jgi:hypothetical protein